MFDIVLRQIKEEIFLPFCYLFRSIHPNILTLVSFLFGICCSYACALEYFNLALLFGILNRIFDGLDGSVARLFNKQSDFGGYLDIVCDFTIYGTVPFGIVLARPSQSNWIALSLLEISYFVNAAGLFQLAAILERFKAGAKTNRELTTVTMPSGLVEGAETMFFYALFLLFPDSATPLFGTFAVLVAVTVLQRLVWAASRLPALAAAADLTQDRQR